MSHCENFTTFCFFWIFFLSPQESITRKVQGVSTGTDVRGGQATDQDLCDKTEKPIKQTWLGRTNDGETEKPVKETCLGTTNVVREFPLSSVTDTLEVLLQFHHLIPSPRFTNYQTLLINGLCTISLSTLEGSLVSHVCPEGRVLSRDDDVLLCVKTKLRQKLLGTT